MEAQKVQVKQTISNEKAREIFNVFHPRREIVRFAHSDWESVQKPTFHIDGLKCVQKYNLHNLFFH